jgi:hypothetical protein
MNLARRFDLLIRLGERLRLTVYNICFRRAGVGIMWCDHKKLEECGEGNYNQSLFVVRYYPTLRKAVDGEYERLLLVKAATPAGIAK